MHTFIKKSYHIGNQKERSARQLTENFVKFTLTFFLLTKTFEILFGNSIEIYSALVNDKKNRLLNKHGTDAQNKILYFLLS